MWPHHSQWAHLGKNNVLRERQHVITDTYVSKKLILMTDKKNLMQMLLASTESLVTNLLRNIVFEKDHLQNFRT